MATTLDESVHCSLRTSMRVSKIHTEYLATPHTTFRVHKEKHIPKTRVMTITTNLTPFQLSTSFFMFEKQSRDVRPERDALAWRSHVVYVYQVAETRFLVLSTY
jgi:hypothetical protein